MTLRRFRARPARLLAAMAALLGALAVGPRPAGAAPGDAPEVCGDGRDNNGNRLTDEGCHPFAVTGVCESPLDCARSGTVSPVTGALVHQVAPDVSVRVPYGPPLVFQRVYTSHYDPGYFPGGEADHTHPLGFGWQHNFMSWLRKSPGLGPATAVVHTTTGQDVLFTLSRPGVDGWDEYRPQAGFEREVLRQRVAPPHDWELSAGTARSHVYDFSTATGLGRLVQVRDGAAGDAAARALVVTYGASGQVSRVTDAAGARHLDFAYGSTGRKLLGSVSLYTDTGGASPVVQREYVYTPAGRLAALQSVADGRTAVDERYDYDAAGRLVEVKPGSGAGRLAAFAYTASGAAARVTTPEGNVGYDYGEPSCNQGRGTVLSFNKAAPGGCTSDASCGAGGFCGGRDAAGLGFCYRARRCLGYETPNEHVITTINGPSCPTCLRVDRYSYDLGPNLDRVRLSGVQIQDRTTTYERDAEGRVIRETHGEDLLPGTPADAVEVDYFYESAACPALVTERRVKSRLSAAGCSRDDPSGCKRTLRSYRAADCELDLLAEKGFTQDVTGAVVPYTYVTDFVRNPEGRLVRRYGPRPVADDVTFTYDAAGRPAQVLLRTGSAVDPIVAQSFGDYDELGNPRDRVEAGSRSVCTLHDSSGRVTRLTIGAPGGPCPRGEAYTFEYLGRGSQPAKVTLPNGNCLRYAYDAEQRLTSVSASDRDPATGACSLAYGDTLTLERDSEGLVTRLELTDGAGAVAWRREQSYGPDGRLQRLLNPVAPATFRELSWSQYGRLRELRHEDFADTGARLELDTDWLSQPSAWREFTGVSASRQWDLSRNASMLPDAVTRLRDPDGHALDMVWDDMDRLVSRGGADGGRTLFAYDEAGNLVAQVDAPGSPDQATTLFAYDLANRLVSMDTADAPCARGGRPEVEYTWDGLPAGACPAGSSCELLGGRLALARTRLYCAPGLADGSFDQRTFHSYDPSGRVRQTTVVDDGGRTSRVGYQHDANGNVTRIDYPTGGGASAAVYGRGSAASASDEDQVSSLSRGATTVLDAVAWYPFGPVRSFRQQNAFWHCSGPCLGFTPTVSYTRNLAYRATAVTAATTAQPPDTLFELTLEEDARGRVTRRRFEPGGNGSQDVCFLYDTLDRVTCQAPSALGACPMACPSGGPPPRYGVGYGDSDDRTSLSIGNAALGPTVQDYVASYLDVGGEPSDRIDALSRGGSGSIRYTWDGRGNRLSDDDSAHAHDRREYTYDARNNLVKVTGHYAAFSLPGGYTLDPYELRHAYDERNRRVFKAFKNTRTGQERQWLFTYDVFDRLLEARYLPEASSPGSFLTYQWYWLQDQPVLLSTVSGASASHAYLYSDERDRVQAAWSWPAAGSPARVWGVEPGLFGWDVPVPGSGAFFQPLRFPGQYYDAETEAVTLGGSGAPEVLRPGLADNRHRAYDSFTGSYLQVDPLLATSLTPYTYVHNDPVNRIDPTGLADAQEPTAADIAAAAAAGATTGAYAMAALQAFLDTVTSTTFLPPYSGGAPRHQPGDVPIDQDLVEALLQIHLLTIEKLETLSGTPR